MAYMHETDEQLYLRYFTDGDEDAFRLLLERYEDSLTFFIFGLVNSMEDAEELMMDSFAAVASGTAKYRYHEDSSFKTWLFAVGRNQARMFLRKKRFSFVSLDESIQITADSPETELLAEESRRQLYEGLSKIKEDYRLVLHLTYFEDMKPEQVAQVMKKSIKQVYNLLSRGKKALREELERMGYSYAQYR